VGSVSGDGPKKAYGDYKAPDRLTTWSDVRSGIWDLMNRQPIGGWALWVPLMLGIVFVSNAPWEWTIGLAVLFVAGIAAAVLLKRRQRSGPSPLSLRGRD
jgi:hypothetical protein